MVALALRHKSRAPCGISTVSSHTEKLERSQKLAGAETRVGLPLAHKPNTQFLMLLTGSGEDRLAIVGQPFRISMLPSI